MKCPYCEQPVAGLEWVDNWIEREFSGHGRAIRERHDSPYPGEPYMSMDDAKALLRQVLVYERKLRREKIRN